MGTSSEDVPAKVRWWPLLAAIAAVVGLFVLYPKAGTRTDSPPPPSVGRPDTPPERRTVAAATGDSIPTPDTSAMQPDVRELVDSARAAVVADPFAIDGWVLFGHVCDAHDLFDCAERCYRRADQLSPNQFRHVYFLARMLDEQGKSPTEVIERYRQAATLRPDYGPVHLRLGQAFEKQGHTVESRHAFARAIELDASLGMAHRLAGQAALAAGDIDEALEHLTRAAAIDPEDGVIFSTLARVYRAKGDQERAGQAATKAQSLERRFRIPDPVVDEVRRTGRGSPIRFHRARKLIESGDYRAALEHLEIVVRATPDQPLVQHYLGLCYRNTGRPEQAEHHFRRVLELDADFVGSLLELTELLVELKRPKEALVFGRHAHTLVPDNAHGQLRLAVALVHAGEFAEAIPLFERSESQLIFNANGYLKWGYALRNTGAIDEAIGRFRTAIQLSPSQPDGYYQLGLTMESMGHHDEAREQYRRAAQIAPNHPAARRLEKLSP